MSNLIFVPFNEANGYAITPSGTNVQVIIPADDIAQPDDGKEVVAMVFGLTGNTNTTAGSDTTFATLDRIVATAGAGTSWVDVPATHWRRYARTVHPTKGGFDPNTFAYDFLFPFYDWELAADDEEQACKTAAPKVGNLAVTMRFSTTGAGTGQKLVGGVLVTPSGWKADRDFQALGQPANIPAAASSGSYQNNNNFKRISPSGVQRMMIHDAAGIRQIALYQPGRNEPVWQAQHQFLNRAGTAGTAPPTSVNQGSLARAVHNLTKAGVAGVDVPDVTGGTGGIVADFRTAPLALPDGSRIRYDVTDQWAGTASERTFFGFVPR